MPIEVIPHRAQNSTVKPLDRGNERRQRLAADQILSVFAGLEIFLLGWVAPRTRINNINMAMNPDPVMLILN